LNIHGQYGHALGLYQTNALHNAFDAHTRANLWHAGNRHLRPHRDRHSRNEPMLALQAISGDKRAGEIHRHLTASAGHSLRLLHAPVVKFSLQPDPGSRVGRQQQLGLLHAALDAIQRVAGQALG